MSTPPGFVKIWPKRRSQEQGDSLDSRLAPKDAPSGLKISATFPPQVCETRQQIPGHLCAGKTKAHYIEVYSDSEEDEDELEQGTTEELRVAEEESLQGELKGGVIPTLSRVPRFHDLRVRGVVHGHTVGVLIDGGETHNFIDAT